MGFNHIGLETCCNQLLITSGVDIYQNRELFKKLCLQGDFVVVIDDRVLPRDNDSGKYLRVLQRHQVQREEKTSFTKTMETQHDVLLNVGNHRVM
jgi:hypothetical protein